MNSLSFPLAVLLGVTLCACSPALTTTTNVQSPTTSLVSFSCSGTSKGTFTSVPATLAFNVDPSSGVLSGAFSSNGTPFQASGTGISTSQGLDIQARVFSGTTGGISGSVGAGIGNFQTGPHIGANMQNGSTGLVSGHLDAAGHFTGRYKANISNYTLTLTCTR